MIDPAVESLRKAREYVQQGWTQGVNARDANGYGVGSCSDNATCWCLEGALIKASPHGWYSLLSLFMEANGIKGHVFNDAPDRTLQEVLWAIDNTIALAEKRAA